MLVSLRNELPEVSFWVVGGQGLLVASQSSQTVQRTFFDKLPPTPGASTGAGRTSPAACADWPHRGCSLRLTSPA